MQPFGEPDPFRGPRLRMVEEQLRRRGIHDERLLRAMEMTPRHEFIPPEYWSHAYSDNPVPIGENQTISQPYIVALMIEALGLQEADTVLEVGTGTGYQAAVLSRLAARVYTVERRASLALRARQNLARLGYHNVEVFVRDGSEGLPDFAPFKRIIVSAAALTVPQALLQQLDEDGIMVIPVGRPEEQHLRKLRKRSGEIYETSLGGCRFVPLIGSGGFAPR